MAFKLVKEENVRVVTTKVATKQEIEDNKTPPRRIEHYSAEMRMQNAKLPQDWWEGMLFNVDTQQERYMYSVSKFAPGVNWWTY